MDATRARRRQSFTVLLTLLVVFSFSANALAQGRVVQDDPNNPIKFSIDEAIATGSVSSPDLYIGTVKSYLGPQADGRTPVFKGGFGQNPNDILIMNGKVGSFWLWERQILGDIPLAPFSMQDALSLSPREPPT